MSDLLRDRVQAIREAYEREGFGRGGTVPALLEHIDALAAALLEALDTITELERELEAQKSVSAYFADRANELEATEGDEG